MINFIREKKLKYIYPILSETTVNGGKTYEPFGIEDLLDKSKQLSNYKDPHYDEQKKMAGENKEQNRINVIITGKTGTGKSTLINSFFNGFLQQELDLQLHKILEK